MKIELDEFEINLLIDLVGRYRDRGVQSELDIKSLKSKLFKKLHELRSNFWGFHNSPLKFYERVPGLGYYVWTIKENSDTEVIIAE